MSKIRIMVVDDHELIRRGLRLILDGAENIDIVAEASNGEEACRLASEIAPDVIFMDISLPDKSGIDVCRRITNANSRIRIIALSQHEESEYVLRMTDAGGVGYMLKNSSRDEFLTAIKNVLAGERYYSQSLSEKMVKELVRRQKTESDRTDQHVYLTRREKEIIRLIAEEFSNQEISDRLHISLRTVETHRRNIMHKLKMKSVVSLIRYAITHHLVTLQEE